MDFIRLIGEMNEADKVNGEAQMMCFDAFHLREPSKSVDFGPYVTHVYPERDETGAH